MKKLLVITLLLFTTTATFAQIKWYNPITIGNQNGVSYIQNQAWNEDGGNYNRFPLRASKTVRKDVYDLGCGSAGLAIRFKTDSREIKVRYQTTSKNFGMSHMPALGVSGVDIYRFDKDGPHYCLGSQSFGDTIKVNCSNSFGGYNGDNEYIMYLPLYNGVTWMEIGIPNGKTFSLVPASKKKPIVIYGTSILQGACASRTGMCWSNIVSRKLDYPLINLGFSGNGRLEKPVLDLINEIDASVYVLDCLPNLTRCTGAEVDSIVRSAVHQIRAQHPATPILLVDHAGYNNFYTDRQNHNFLIKVNTASLKAYNTLKVEGVKELYYLSQKELGFKDDYWEDYVHPNELGMVVQANAVIGKIARFCK